MAYINNYYVFVDSDGESSKRSVSISDHPVEEGMVITDHVQRDPTEIQLSGLLVGSDAETVKSNLEKLQKDGSKSYKRTAAMSNTLAKKFCQKR